MEEVPSPADRKVSCMFFFYSLQCSVNCWCSFGRCMLSRSLGWCVAPRLGLVKGVSVFGEFFWRCFRFFFYLLASYMPSGCLKEPGPGRLGFNCIYWDRGHCFGDQVESLCLNDWTPAHLVLSVCAFIWARHVSTPFAPIAVCLPFLHLAIESIRTIIG